jgi:pimeloyl-ACP methyl ester carboxylesterase
MPFARSGDFQIHYEVEGAGPPLVLHTGFVSAGHDWYDMGYVEALERDYRLIIPDPLGQGESDKPHATEACSPEHRVADVVAVLDALAVDRAHFWGYSMGGRVGFDMGVRRPDRLTSLVLGGAHPFGGPPNVGWAELLGQGMSTFMTGNASMLGALPREIHDRWLTNDAEALRASTLNERPSLETSLGAIQLPVLIYCGDRDAPYEAARKAAEAMPNATFVSVPGLGHVEVIVNSDLVLPHVRGFLAGLPAAPAAA